MGRPFSPSSVPTDQCLQGPPPGRKVAVPHRESRGASQDQTCRNNRATTIRSTLRMYGLIFFQLRIEAVHRQPHAVPGSGA
jgi:hypothetical protein